MARDAAVRKEHLVFAAKILFLLILLGVSLLVDFPVYFKISSVLVVSLFLMGWLLSTFSKSERRCQHLVEAQHRDSQKLNRLSELATELSKTQFVRDKFPEITPKLADVFGDYFNSTKFVLFVKKGDTYRAVLANDVTLPQKGKIRIKSNSEFISKVKSIDESKDLEFIHSGKAPASLKSLHKQHRFDRLIPLATGSDLWGFVLLTPDTSLDAEHKSSWPNLEAAENIRESRLPFLVLNQIALNLERDELARELRELQNRVNSNAKQDKAQLAALNRDLKRKIFDLNAVLGLVKNLHSVVEEEGLFSLLAKMMQDHLGAKSVFLMFPDRENGDIVGEHLYGAHTSDLFGKETISQLRIEKGKALYNWIKNEKQIWQLYTMQKLSREDRLLRAVLASGFQIGAKLSFSGDSFGLVFLGEKTDGAKYRQTDLDILAILVNMAVITYKNIRHFKSIEALSYTDSITALYNYRYFYKRLTEEVFRAKRFSRKLALVIFDIDDFKIYNDSYGHQAGDQLLKQLGELLIRTVRSIDVVSRYGGEEFCVIMPESDQDECLKFMERLRKGIMNFAFKDEYLKHEHNITVSLGGAIYPHDARSVDRLIYCADMALLKAKTTGKNRSVMYQEKLVAVGQ
ncbi:MAG: diguanylate cyclase [candidate division Zixibacteria bacterium]|nr:diguanylate cyclase [candidate division Zixibacteria bacterium]